MKLLDKEKLIKTQDKVRAHIAQHSIKCEQLREAMEEAERKLARAIHLAQHPDAERTKEEGDHPISMSYLNGLKRTVKSARAIYNQAELFMEDLQLKDNLASNAIMSVDAEEAHAQWNEVGVQLAAVLGKYAVAKSDQRADFKDDVDDINAIANEAAVPLDADNIDMLIEEDERMQQLVASQLVLPQISKHLMGNLTGKTRTSANGYSGEGGGSLITSPTDNSTMMPSVPVVEITKQQADEVATLFD